MRMAMSVRRMPVFVAVGTAIAACLRSGTLHRLMPVVVQEPREHEHHHEAKHSRDHDRLDAIMRRERRGTARHEGVGKHVEACHAQHHASDGTERKLKGAVPEAHANRDRTAGNAGCAHGCERDDQRDGGWYVHRRMGAGRMPAVARPASRMGVS